MASQHSEIMNRDFLDQTLSNFDKLLIHLKSTNPNDIPVDVKSRLNKTFEKYCNLLSCWDVFNKFENNPYKINNSLWANDNLLKYMYEDCIHYVIEKSTGNQDLFCAVCKIGFDCTSLVLSQHLNDPSHFVHFDRFKKLIDDRIWNNPNLYFFKYSFGKFIEYVDHNTLFCKLCGINVRSDLLNHFNGKSHWDNFNEVANFKFIDINTVTNDNVNDESDKLSELTKRKKKTEQNQTKEDTKNSQRITKTESDKTPERNLKIEPGLKSLEMTSSSSTKFSKGSKIAPKSNTPQNKEKQQTSRVDKDKHRVFMARIANVNKTSIKFYCQPCNYYEISSSDFDIKLHATSIKHKQFTKLKVNLMFMKFTWNRCDNCNVQFFCSSDFYLYHNQSNEHRVLLNSVSEVNAKPVPNKIVPKPDISNVNYEEIIKNGVLHNLRLLEKRKNVKLKDCMFNFCINCNIQVSSLSKWHKHLITPDHKHNKSLKRENKIFACDCNCIFFCDNDLFSKHLASNEHMNLKLVVNNLNASKRGASDGDKNNHDEMIKNGIQELLRFLYHQKQIRNRNCRFNYCSVCYYSTRQVNGWKNHISSFNHKYNMNLKPDNKLFECGCNCSFICVDNVYTNHRASEEHKNLRAIVENLPCNNKFDDNAGKNSNLKQCLLELTDLQADTIEEIPTASTQNGATRNIVEPNLTAKVLDKSFSGSEADDNVKISLKGMPSKMELHSHDEGNSDDVDEDDDDDNWVTDCESHGGSERTGRSSNDDGNTVKSSISDDAPADSVIEHERLQIDDDDDDDNDEDDDPETNSGNKNNKSKPVSRYWFEIKGLPPDVMEDEISEAFEHLGQIRYLKKCHPNLAMLLILSRTEIDFGNETSTILIKDLFYKIELKKSEGCVKKRTVKYRVVNLSNITIVNVFRDIFNELVQFYTDKPARIDVRNQTYAFCCVPCNFTAKQSNHWNIHINKSKHKNKVSNLLCEVRFCDCFTTILSDDIFFSVHKISKEHDRLKNVISSRILEITTGKINFGEQNPNVGVSVSSDLIKSIDFYNNTVGLYNHIQHVIERITIASSTTDSKINYGLFCCLCVESLLKNNSCSNHLKNYSHKYNKTLEPDYKQYNCDCGISIICNQDFYCKHQISDGHKALKNIIQQKLMNIKTDQDSGNVDVNETKCNTSVNHIERKLLKKMDYKLSSVLIDNFFESIIDDINVLELNGYYIFFCFPCNYIESNQLEWLQHVDGEDHKKNSISDLDMKFHSCHCNSVIFCNDAFYSYHTTTKIHKNVDFLYSYIHLNIQNKKFNRNIFEEVKSEFEPSINNVSNKEFKSLIVNICKKLFFDTMCGTKGLKIRYLFLCNPCDFVETRESVYTRHVRSNTHNNNVISNQDTKIYECDCCITLICDENFYSRHLESIEHYVLKLIISQRLEEIKSKLPFVSSDYEDEDVSEVNCLS